MQGLIRLIWEVFIISLMEFLIKTGLRTCLIELVWPNLRHLLSYSVLSTMMLSVRIHCSYRCASAFSEDERQEVMVNITFICVQWM